VRALVTNDDGIESEGLRFLAQAALDCKCDVVVAAPQQDSSGSSASLAGFASDGRIVVHRRDLEGMPDVTAFAVAAAPSLITLIATYGAFGPRPDVVLSGINVGPNLGTAVLHSGTVGAAMTGRVQGCRAMSVSLTDTRGVAHWDTAASVVRHVLQWLSDIDDEVVLNVNVPNVAPADLRGLRYGEIKSFGSVQTMMIERGEGWVRTRIADPERAVDPDSDAAQVEDGFASVTALRPLCTAHPPDVSLLLAADAPIT
jgi:5'-nucleotidase